MEHISGYTQTTALIGSPVEHSLSPAMHTASFQELGIDAVYLAYDVQVDGLEAAVAGMTALGFAGYSVTMPLKTAIPPLLDELTDAAALMGAVNCVAVKDGRTVGHNTDGAGFMRNVREHGVDIIGKKITLVGAGGAGSAIYTQAALDGVTAIDVYNLRDAFFDATAERIQRVANQTGCALRLIDLADQDALRASIAESALVVNATRVGMGDLADQTAIPADFLVPGVAVADTVYSPRETTLLKMAKARGLQTIGGLGMLLWQAAIAEDIWFGREMPTALIEEKFFA